MSFEKLNKDLCLDTLINIHIRQKYETVFFHKE